MGQRLQLQAKLVEILGSPHVYFQPPASVKMQYPAIVYHRDYELSQHADNSPYHRRKRYMVTVIDEDPDSGIPDKITALPMSTFVRHFTLANLNHDIINLYF